MNIDTENSEIRNFSFIIGLALIILNALFFIIKKWAYIKPYIGLGTELVFLIAIIIMAVGILIPQLLKPLFKLWTGFSNFLGNLNTKIILGLIFYIVITPMAFLLRLKGKDYLKLKFDKTAKTYWEDKKEKFDKNTLLKQY